MTQTRTIDALRDVSVADVDLRTFRAALDGGSLGLDPLRATLERR